jgi:ssDNA-binding replication factor A large subunit
MQNYDLLIERISKASGIDPSEIERRVEAKKAKLSGLISKEGAAQIIAAELGVSFENQDLKICEIMSGMKKANIYGKVINIFPVREFNKNGREGKVANFIIADETGNTRVVLWDTNHIDLIESGRIKVGDVVEIKNASVRDSEIHLSGFSELKKSDKKMVDIKTERTSVEESLDKVKQGQNVNVRGVIVQIFQPRFYSVCPTCNKKVIPKDNMYTCAEHGVVTPKDRAILNFVLDDGTETMRVVLFSEQINILIPEEDLKDEPKALKFKEDLLGTEVKVIGIVKRNQLFNNLEIIGSDIKKVDVEKLIEELEAK